MKHSAVVSGLVNVSSTGGKVDATQKLENFGELVRPPSPALYDHPYWIIKRIYDIHKDDLEKAHGRLTRNSEDRDYMLSIMSSRR